MGYANTCTARLMQVIKQKIASRSLVAGDKLPSIRQFARTMKVSPSTVVEAYDRLVAEGFITPRKGSGFFVTNQSLQPLILTTATTPEIQAVDPFWVSKQSLDASAETLKPGYGWLPLEWMPNDALRKAFRTVSRSEDALLSRYGLTKGSIRLRRLLTSRFAEEGLMVNGEDILLTGSGTQSIDLICRLLLKRGETVLVDDPCYFNFQAILRSHEVRIIGVPYTASGPDTDVFERIISEEKPKLYITNSALHNPTGATISPQTAFRLLSAAKAANLIIVEDDIFTDFEDVPSTRLAVLDGLERVIRIGSFSKTLSASVRCGYIAARPDLISGLTDLQVASSFGGPSPVITEVIAEVLERGHYRKHVTELKRRLEQARAQTLDRLATLDITPWTIPRGGFYLWCQLPDGMDSTQIALQSRQENIIHAPGNVFSINQNASSFLRLNASQCHDDRIFDSLAKLLR